MCVVGEIVHKFIEVCNVSRIFCVYFSEYQFHFCLHGVIFHLYACAPKYNMRSEKEKAKYLRAGEKIDMI